ncbi:unnamed protein product [Closterium sp. NIES-54]
MKRLSDEKQKRMMQRIAEGRSYRQITQKLGVSKSAIHDELLHHLGPKTFNDLVPSSAKPGRPLKLPEQIARIVIRSIMSGESKSAEAAAGMISSTHGISVMGATVRNTLKQHIVRAIEKPSKPRFSAKNVKDRRQWAKDHQHWTISGNDIPFESLFLKGEGEKLVLLLVYVDDSSSCSSLQQQHERDLESAAAADEELQMQDPWGGNVIPRDARGEGSGSQVVEAAPGEDVASVVLDAGHRRTTTPTTNKEVPVGVAVRNMDMGASRDGGTRRNQKNGANMVADLSDNNPKNNGGVEKTNERTASQFFHIGEQGQQRDASAKVGAELHPLDYCVLDTGAAWTMTPRKELLDDVRAAPINEVCSASGHSLKVAGATQAAFKGRMASRWCCTTFSLFLISRPTSSPSVSLPRLG